MIRSFGIVLLALGISLSIVGYLLTNLDMTSMYWATLAGPAINIIGLILLAFSLFKHEEKSTAH